jgi:hypothetical protein
VQKPPFQPSAEQQANAMAAALDEVSAMQDAARASGSSTRILVASLRSAEEMAVLAARVSEACRVARLCARCKPAHLLTMTLLLHCNDRFPARHTTNRAVTRSRLPPE